MTGTWGRAGGLQGRGVGGGRQPPGRLRLRPQVKAPGASKGLENLPVLPKPPSPLPTHTHTHLRGEAGVGRAGDQRLSWPHHFLLNVSKINRTSKGNSPNSLEAGWREELEEGVSLLGDFSLGGGQLCALELPFPCGENCPPPSRDAKFAQSWPRFARTIRAEASEGCLRSAWSNLRHRGLQGGVRFRPLLLKLGGLLPCQAGAGHEEILLVFVCLFLFCFFAHWGKEKLT